MSYLVPTVVEQSSRGERPTTSTPPAPGADVMLAPPSTTTSPTSSPPNSSTSTPRATRNPALRQLTGRFDERDVRHLRHHAVLRSPVATICNGLAASAAAVIVAGGDAGRRRALPNARILIHQPHGGAQGQSVDIEIQAKEMAFLRGRMHEILAFHSGQSVEKIERDTDRDYILSAEDAVTYGLIDQVIRTSGRLTAVAAATP